MDLNLIWAEKGIQKNINNVIFSWSNKYFHILLVIDYDNKNYTFKVPTFWRM